MTTHVFIVDENTFKYHLEYMFAGTGVGSRNVKTGQRKNYKYVDFNNTPTSNLYPNQKHAAEAGLVAMMADCSRMRKGDYVLFYLQATRQQEGCFFGLFKVKDVPFIDCQGNYLETQLYKNLTFRVEIEPYQVYAKGVTEWQALDEIRNIPCPCQMLWSLIYRKLKGNRGNTMITIYESERLIDLIQKENNFIPFSTNIGFSYKNGQIVIGSATNSYNGSMDTMNILPRLIAKYNNRLSHEVHLQMYITQNIGLGTNPSLDKALGVIGKKIEWLGNEVSCGVGMQRIDVMFSVYESETKRILCPIELKAVPVSVDNTRQLNRYIDWIEQYYIPNRISIIQPVLICRKDKQVISNVLKQNFRDFNKRKGILPLKYIEYEVVNNNLVFSIIPY